MRRAIRLALHRRHERTLVTHYVFSAADASCWCGYAWPTEWSQ